MPPLAPQSTILVHFTHPLDDSHAEDLVQREFLLVHVRMPNSELTLEKQKSRTTVAAKMSSNETEGILDGE